MNDRFFMLPVKKQEAIINAGFKVFSENSYKKSPMLEIAEAANISKALLFYYFHNKKELYHFLLQKAMEITIQDMKNDGLYEIPDLFEVMRKGLMTKVRIMKEYPALSAFTIKAYYEKDPEVLPDILTFIKQFSEFKKTKRIFQIDSSMFKPGLDLELMYQEMFWASEGYIWERLQKGNLDIDEMERDFKRLFDFWEQLYKKEG